MVRTRPISAAIKAAFVEGKLLRKSGFVIRRTAKRAIAKIDKQIGNTARKLIYDRTEVIPGKIMFITFQGEYTCNPKYITEELVRRNIDCDIVWSLRKSSIKHSLIDPDYLPANVRCVEQYTEEFFDELASSEIWIANSVDFLKREIPKKSNQFFIETWHGSLGLKRFDASVNKGKAWVKAAQLCTSYTDVLLSNSSFEDNVYRNSFWPNTPIFHAGHPRNDVFFRHDSQHAADLKAQFCKQNNLNPESHFVLYAPTFRDNHQFDCYCMSPTLIEHAFEERFGGEWKIITRYHPTVAKYVTKRANSNLGIDATSYPDIQELMLFCDAAITDYSSWIYDFMLSGKPCFIFASDLDHYRNDERGFYYPIETTPFAIAASNQQLISQIKSFDEVIYQERLRQFIQEKGCIEDGRATERTCDFIESLLKNGRNSLNCIS